MAIREVIEKTTLAFRQDEEFRAPIPRLVHEAEGGDQRVVWLWQDFCKSVDRHLTAHRPATGIKRFVTGGGRRNQMQQTAFCYGLERICADFERCCENVTIYPFVGRYKIGLRLHRFKVVPIEDRHQNQLFVATIPEYERSVPVRATIPAYEASVSVRATFIGLLQQQDDRDHAPLPIVAAEAVVARLVEDVGSFNHELLPMAVAEVA
jgi:hypothetical protein